MRLSFSSARDIVRMVRGKEVSAKDVVEEVLDAISRIDPQVKAYLRVDEEGALKQAEEVDRRLARGEEIGSLGGLPVTLKDIFCVRGEETTCASKILVGFYSPYNATIIEKLRDNGAIFVGRTNMDEFAMGSTTENSAFGVTRNPWDLERVPGGSSGGSAAAVAAREAIVALGSDTGGSIRQPASFCGCVGIKPTYGRVSRYGLVAYASSLDQIGNFGRDVYDVAMVLRVLAGHDMKDSTSADIEAPDYAAALDEEIRELKIGIPKEYFGEGLSAEVRAAIEKAIKALESLGAITVEVSLPHTEYAIAAYYIIASAEASSNLARYDGVQYGHRTKSHRDLEEMYTKSKGEGFGAEVKRRIIMGTYALSSGYYDAYYLKALKVRTLIKRDFEEALKKVDCLITPVSPTPAFKIGEKVNDPLTMYLSDIYTISCNLAGLPGISIPCGFDSEGMPISFQLLGQPFGEGTILRIGHAYQQVTDFHKRVPPVADRAASA
ncbi:MAG: Asp-tRNA(Asn)/Glu-tRNA(Gln) amidotransferase subunit GatA [bacterium]|nr:Asp-tRNA(Asn)/Glu-tRNA(Gln) amidotransferase subunit GatA [bacterium]